MSIAAASMYEGRLQKVVPTELGWIGVALTQLGVVRLVFDCLSADAAREALMLSEFASSARTVSKSTAREFGEDTSPNEGMRCSAAAWHRLPMELLEQRLQGYAAGRREPLDEIPLDLSRCTPFQRRVLQACREIPYGQVRTYAELAVAAGSPRAARAVGNVMARNRLPLLIPCHRVVASQGGLGGFSARSGLSMKRRLLQMEAGK